MALSDYIPNIFGQAAPSYLGGLLGPEETQNLQGRANVQGLLGAGLALAQGMSRTGPRRSAAENILGALGGGFGAAGGAYEQGVKNYVTQQQINQTNLAQTQAANKLKSIQAAKLANPDIAYLADIDPGKFAEEVALKERLKGIGGTQGTSQMPTQTPAALRAQAQRAYMAGPNFKALGDSYTEMANRLEVEQAGRGDVPVASTAAPQQQTTQEQKPGIIVTANGNDAGYGIPNVAAGERYKFPEQQTSVDPQTGERVLPAMTVSAQQGPDAQLLATKNNLITRNRALFGIPTKDSRDERKANEESISKIDEQLKQISSATFNWVNIEKEVPEKFRPQIRNLQTLADTGYLGLDQIRLGVQDVYKQVQESEKGSKIDGLPGVYAQQKFGITDQTKLKPEQLADVLRFANAPTADQYAQLARESLSLRAEKGVVAPLPVDRSVLINAPARVTNKVSVNQAQEVPVTTQQTDGRQPPARPANPPVGTPVRTTTAPTATARASVNTPDQQAVVKSPYFKVDNNPLINRREIDLPIKDRQKLLEAQTGFISSNQYTLTNIIDARNVAKSLLANPAYLDALTSRTAQLYAKSPAGITLDQNTFTANEILSNLQGRSFISEIQAMRANSPTGGAVGNVAVAEMTTLSNIGAALKLGMSRAELVRQLQSYVDRSDGALKSIPNQYTKVYGYNGEFDDIFSREVVKPTATQNKPPRGVTVNRVP